MSAEIRPPQQPPEPDYEEENNLTDLAHDWDLEGEMWDGDIHGGYQCKRCEEMSDCTSCNPKWKEDLGCLREQANNRNLKKRSEYMQALKDYQAQLSYYNREVKPHVAG